MRDVAKSGGRTADFGSVQHAARAATDLNRRFRAGESDGRYLTMVLCVLDTHDGRLRVTSAGHSPLLRGGETVDVPDAGGFPISMFDTGDYEDAVVQLRPGHRLCLYSDGIGEQTPATGDEQFGDIRLRQSLASRADAPAERVAEGVVDDLAAWAGSRAFTEDVSVVVIDWRGQQD